MSATAAIVIAFVLGVVAGGAVTAWALLVLAIANQPKGARREDA